MALEEYKEELAPFARGSSFSQVFKCLYYFQLLKLSTQSHLKAVNFDPYGKVVTKKKLQALVNLNYLKSHQNEERGEPIFTTTKKNLQALEAYGYITLLLPAQSEGRGSKESLYNTDEFVKALHRQNFKALLFPNFKYIIPDGLLVLADEGRYQLNFLEIEKPKPEWHQHLAIKKQNYKRLARDPEVYRYWKKRAKLLSLPVNRETFKFRVLCIGNIKKDWDGWVFRESL
ncbi:MAG: hypothetical protein ACOCQ4_01680 [bacterium]